MDWATRIEAGALGTPRGQVLAGLHALDYDSAVLAGSVAAAAGLEGVSLGFMGAMTDRNYVDFRVEQGQLIKLPRSVPRSYLRVVESTAGLIEGYRQAGKPRPALHALGVGTPILVPLLGLMSGGEPYFAMDSTSPIVDGWSSPTISLYVDEPAPFKYKAYKIAGAWIRGERGWDCQCFDCQAFHAAHPPRVAEARRWWEREGRPKIRKEMLERDGALSTFLPLLAYPADDALRREASLARVGHNHGVLRRLERAVRDRADDPQALDRWVGALVNEYRSASRSPAWAAAVEIAYRLARRVALTAANKEGQP